MRSWLTIGCAALLLGTVGSPANGAEAKNLLTNGGFEQGLAGWQPDAGHERLTKPGAAHAGEACLTGEVTKPRTHLTLTRRVKVEPGNLYRFEIWARATNRTKLVLWVVQPGAKQRSLVAAWRRLAPRWRRYSTPLTVHGRGELELQLIAPSSHGEPAGRIWVDDVALYETEMPPLATVSGEAGFNDEPAMALAGDGSAIVAWNSYRLAEKAEKDAPYAAPQGYDTLQVTRYVPRGKAFDAAGAWQVLGGPRIYVLDVEAAQAGEQVAVLYAAEAEGQWDVHAVMCDADGPGTPLAITRDAAVDVKPAAAWHDGTLWVAWESNRGRRRQVLAAPIRGGKVGEPDVVSESDGSSYAPAIAVLDSGEVCVAWHSFESHNYDIYLRRRSPAGSWGKIRRLTQAPQVDRHPVLASHGDQLWLLYENAEVGKGKPYRIGATDRRRLVVAQVTAEGLMAPKGYAKSALYTSRCEAASAAFDATGRLWIAFLKPRLPRSGWDAFLTCYAGQEWYAPAPLSSAKGMDRRPKLAIAGDRALVAVQTDDIPRSWGQVDRTYKAQSKISLASVRLDGAPKATAMQLEPLAEPDAACEAADLRQQFGEDQAPHSIAYQGKTLNLYFGDLHEHTDISVCNRVGDQSVDESYQHMRDIARYDFACATDHGYNINSYLWTYLGKLARTNNDPGRFLTFLGEEWTSSFEKYSEEHPYGYYGHRNLVFADPYFPRWWNSRNGQTPAQVWEQLREMNANFVQIPHQIADTGNVPTDWNFTDRHAQPVAEIFQIRGSYEYKGAPREAGRSTPKPGYFVQDAWARGVVIGVIAAPDHGGGYGKAAVYAPELSRDAILDALRARHCYGTTAAKMLLDVRVNGHLMGEAVADPPGERVEVKMDIQCPGEIDRVEVCRNNRFIYTKQPKGRKASLVFTDREPLPGRSYYYVRVIQTDEEIAWTSPVWFGAE
jgi:hypothetical protein